MYRGCLSPLIFSIAILRPQESVKPNCRSILSMLAGAVPLSNIFVNLEYGNSTAFQGACSTNLTSVKVVRKVNKARRIVFCIDSNEACSQYCTCTTTEKHGKYACKRLLQRSATSGRRCQPDKCASPCRRLRIRARAIKGRNSQQTVVC